MGDISTTETGFKLTITPVVAGTPQQEEKKKQPCTYKRLTSESDQNDPDKKDKDGKFINKYTSTDTECYVGGYKVIQKDIVVTSITKAETTTNEYGEEFITITYEATITTTTTEYKLSEEESITVTKDSSKAVPLGTQSTTIQLYYLAFNRQVYKPNEVVADLCIGKTDISSANLNQLLGRYVKIERYSKTESQSVATTEETFSGFYIHDILPLKEENMYPYVRCHIYSLDHQLTLKKYSRAYTGSQLFADILLEGYKSSVTDYQKGSFQYNKTASTEQSLYFPTYYKQKATTDNDDTLTTFDHLACKITYSKKASSGADYTEEKKTTERIQPYLVQYNESFYDFMVRTANRCGEFFFWDDNALRLGRTCTGAGSLPTGQSLDTTISDSECKTIFYSAFDSDNSYKTEFFTSDPLNDLAIVPELNSSNIGSAINNISANKKYYYNEEVNHDIYRTRVYEDRFDSYEKEEYFNKVKFVLNYFSRVLNSTSIYDIIKKFLLYEPISAIISAARSAYENLTWNKLHLIQDQRKHKEYRRFSHKKSNDVKNDSNYTYFSSFTTADTNGHVDSTFYEKIRKNEEILSQKLITFNLKEAKRFRLGQVITYDSTDYAIIQIKINLNDNASKFSAIDPEGDATFSDMKAGVAMQVVAIPVIYTDTAKTTYEVYPPMHPAGHVRHSEPQTAIVSDFMDPQQRGRVRIIYPWQYETDTEASPWIRVLTPSATPGTGCTFPLAVGDEVLVNYESNNIERPYVVGSLFNRTNFASPDMAIKSKNGHNISFTNPIDSTKFLQGVSPMYNFLRPFLPNFEAGSLDDLKLTGGITISDYFGFYKIDMSTDQRKIDISSPFGKVNIDAFTGITISAPNGDITIKGKNVNIEAGNTVKITSGTNIREKSFFGANLDGEWNNAMAGGVMKTLGALGDAVSEFIKPSLEVVDFQLLRTMMEVVLRPIDGTLQIKSYKYLLLEAGSGDATIKSDRYKATKAPNDNENMLVLIGLEGAIEKIDEKVDAYIRGITPKQDKLDADIRAYNTRHDAIDQANAGKLKDDCPANGANIATEVYHAGTPTAKTYAAADIKAANIADDDADVTALLGLANTVATSALDYYQYVKQLGTYSAHPLGNDQMGNAATTKGKYYTNLANTATDAVNTINIADFQNHAADDNLLTTTKKNMKKKWFKALFSNLTTTQGFPLTVNQIEKWNEYIHNICYKTMDPKEMAMIGVKSIFKGYCDFGEWFKNYAYKWDLNHWESGKPGQIILSDQATQSFYFKQDGNAEIYPNKTTKEKQLILDKLHQMLYGWID